MNIAAAAALIKRKKFIRQIKDFKCRIECACLFDSERALPLPHPRKLHDVDTILSARNQFNGIVEFRKMLLKTVFIITTTTTDNKL